MTIEELIEAITSVAKLPTEYLIALRGGDEALKLAILHDLCYQLDDRISSLYEARRSLDEAESIFTDDHFWRVRASLINQIEVSEKCMASMMQYINLQLGVMPS